LPIEVGSEECIYRIGIGKYLFKAFPYFFEWRRQWAFFFATFFVFARLGIEQNKNQGNRY